MTAKTSWALYNPHTFQVMPSRYSEVRLAQSACDELAFETGEKFLVVQLLLEEMK